MAQSSGEHLERAKDFFEKNEVDQSLHELRKSIDAIIQWTDELRRHRESSFGREVSIVHTKLQEAKMWAGKCLEANNSQLPEEFRDEAN